MILRIPPALPASNDVNIVATVYWESGKTCQQYNNASDSISMVITVTYSEQCQRVLRTEIEIAATKVAL